MGLMPVARHCSRLLAASPAHPNGNLLLIQNTRGVEVPLRSMLVLACMLKDAEETIPLLSVRALRRTSRVTPLSREPSVQARGRSSEVEVYQQVPRMEHYTIVEHYHLLGSEHCILYYPYDMYLFTVLLTALSVRNE